MRVIEELFKRGDIVNADGLKAPTAPSTRSPYSMSSLRSSLSSYIWGQPKPAPVALDTPIVPIAALKSISQRAENLSGAVATADIYTIKTFADEITAGNTRDAEAVVSHLVSKGEATTLFTVPTKDDPNTVLGLKLGKMAATQADRDMLRTKAALERMEKLSAHLQESIDTEKAAAVQAAKNGNKVEALARLKKKKGLEAKLNVAKASATKLSAVLMAVDEAESNKEAVAALETGMASLKTVTADGVTADRVDAVAQDFDELLAEQEDVRTAFTQLNQDAIGPDEAELEDELDKLVSGKSEETPEKSEAHALTEEEKELLKLMGAVEISKEDAAKIQDPAAAAMANAEKIMEDAAKLGANATTGGGITIPALPQ